MSAAVMYSTSVFTGLLTLIPQSKDNVIVPYFIHLILLLNSTELVQAEFYLPLSDPATEVPHTKNYCGTHAPIETSISVYFKYHSMKFGQLCISGDGYLY
jgi:hypothetical protein